MTCLGKSPKKKGSKYDQSAPPRRIIQCPHPAIPCQVSSPGYHPKGTSFGALDSVSPDNHMIRTEYLHR